MASVNTYDAIVLDWMLPDRDGIAVCQSLRGSGLHVPILILTARDAIEDRVLGLNSGADDYLTSPSPLPSYSLASRPFCAGPS